MLVVTKSQNVPHHRPGEGWKYSSGFINAEIIEKALFPPSEDNLVKI